MIPTPRLEATTQRHSRRFGVRWPDRYPTTAESPADGKGLDGPGPTRADKTYLNLGQQLILGHFYRPTSSFWPDEGGATGWSGSVGNWDKADTLTVALSRSRTAATSTDKPGASHVAVLASDLGIWGRCRVRSLALLRQGRRLRLRRRPGRHRAPSTNLDELGAAR